MKINFTPGPSQLYVTTESHIKNALREGIPSISHRSKEFESIYAQVVEGLTHLLGIPKGFHIVFTASATEIWERSIQSLVQHESLHLVNGAFSKKYYETATQLGKAPALIEVPDGQGFEHVSLPNTNPELVALTQNETSTGVALPVEFVHSFRTRYPGALIAVDAVSSLPHPKFDFNAIDLLFFSVQKAFGLPAGLGVWIVNDRCVAKAEQLQAAGISIGSYHSLPSLVSMAAKRQTPETPNVLGIYLLAQVTADFLRRGIQVIRQETAYKATLLYQTLDQLSFARPFVATPANRSQTVIVAETAKAGEIVKALQPKGLFPGDGYGKAKASQLRFANFPTHSKEQYELLVDSLQSLAL